VSQGGLAGTVVDPKVVFAAALKARASSLILAHNHPSGNLKPSQADTDLTNKIKQGGELLDIAILDHLILSPEGGYFSFADEGLM
jgi:DNA repair protein RadC